ncbi:hypothetical protein MVEN_00895900 [Mycena venus]|uniref:Uncharacterized protein n=1 Tax=Mycena venus TaxID=2733690 RepID=A0A8H6YGA3_9AGAR|nr:hypothetical protein MVEN_00895900 [Mycena venus]
MDPSSDHGSLAIARIETHPVQHSRSSLFSDATSFQIMGGHFMSNNIYTHTHNVSRVEETAVRLLRNISKASPTLLRDFINAFSRLGAELSTMGRHQDALDANEEAAELLRKLATTDSSVTHDLANALINLGSNFRALGRYEDALHADEEAAELWRKPDKDNHLVATAPKEILQSLYNWVQPLYNWAQPLYNWTQASPELVNADPGDLQCEDSGRSGSECQNPRVDVLNKNRPVETATFAIYSPHGDAPETPAHPFTPKDMAWIETEFGSGGCLLSIHDSTEAASWIEDNWETPLLTSVRNSGCGGPFAWMLSPIEPALAIFGCCDDPLVVNMAQSLADLSAFPVVIRAASDNPALTLLNNDAGPPDGYYHFNNATGNNDQRGRDLGEDEAPTENERNSGEAEDGGARDDDLNDVASDGAGFKRAGDPETNWDGNTRALGGGDGGRTRIKLCLNLNNTQTYPVTILYSFRFTINGETQTPVHPNKLSEALYKPEVMALVDLKIKNRPHETLVDRSYANIGFVAHREQSIFDEEFLSRGYDPPDSILEYGQQQQNQLGFQVTAGWSSHSPLVTAMGSGNRTKGTTVKATDTKATPRWCVDSIPGDDWSKANKSYSSYDLVYRAQDIPLDDGRPAFHPFDVKMGMGISLQLAASEPVPQISFIHRNLVPIWVYDSKSKAGIRGIAVLMSSYVDDIKTREGLRIWEEVETDLGTGISIVPKTREDEPGIISMSIAEVEKKDNHKSGTRSNTLSTKSSLQSSDRPVTLMPPHVYHARGWNAENGEWRNVWWPALDECFRKDGPGPVQTPSVWKFPWMRKKV